MQLSHTFRNLHFHSNIFSSNQRFFLKISYFFGFIKHQDRHFYRSAKYFIKFAFLDHSDVRNIIVRNYDVHKYFHFYLYVILSDDKQSILIVRFYDYFCNLPYNTIVL